MTQPPLIELRDVNVVYRSGSAIGLFRKQQNLHAVRDVNFELQVGQTHGLVGESGSGKSSIGRAVLQLVPIASGKIFFGSENIHEMDRASRRHHRRSVQAIFQDPYSSLNSSMPVRQILAEALANSRTSPSSLREASKSPKIPDLLEQVGLEAGASRKYPSEFSGGQRQRIAIARALAVDPQVIVCDEAVSALDVSTQSQILELLKEIQRKTQVAYLFIAHDLSVVQYMSDTVSVLYRGRLMESGPAQRVYETPAHPYTASLISATPELSSARRASRRKYRDLFQSKTASTDFGDDGCVFTARCPFAMDKCRDVPPHLAEVDGGGHSYCHLESDGVAWPNSASQWSVIETPKNGRYLGHIDERP